MGVQRSTVHDYYIAILGTFWATPSRFLTFPNILPLPSKDLDLAGDAHCPEHPKSRVTSRRSP